MAVRVRAGDASGGRDWVLEEERTSGGASVRRWSADGWQRMRFGYREHAIDFVLSPRGDEVHASWTGQVTPEHVGALAAGPILGRALRLRGVPCLHASAVEVDGRAVALLGQAGAGKSTLAAALRAEGHRLLCDDFAALAEAGGGFAIHPGQARLRLWPDSAERLGGAATEPVFPGIDEFLKRAIEDESPPPGQVELAAVYVLGPRAEAVEIASMAPAERIAALARNVYGELRLPGELRAAEFALLGRLAEAVPVLSLRLADDLDAVSEAARAVAEDAASR